ncbi:MAG: alpha/beta hydrolase [Anaerolineales bacterium]|jgi:3-oxoadipate enol-lactonase
MSVVILKDEIVHYEVLGRGRPIIFLHGWVGSWRYWIPTMQAASTGFRTYAIDLWGFGDTAKNSAYYSLNQQVDLLDLFLGELGIGKIALVGHGLGAVISLLYARRFPTAVDRLMLTSLPTAGHPVNPRLLGATPGELADWLLDPSIVNEAVRLEAPKTDMRAIQNSLREAVDANLFGVCVELLTPCLMVYGQDDPAVMAENPEPTDTYPANIHQIYFEQCGHFPMLEENSKYNRLMVDFLSLESGESPRQLQLKEEWKRRVR